LALTADLGAGETDVVFAVHGRSCQANHLARGEVPRRLQRHFGSLGIILVDQCDLEPSAFAGHRVGLKLIPDASDSTAIKRPRLARANASIP